MSRDLQPTRRGLPTPGVAAPSDRRFRRSDTPPVRRRRERMRWRITRWMVLVAGLLLMVSWGGRRLVASDVFLVREVTVRGNVHLSSREVETLLSGIHRENVLLVDFERYRRQVLDSSWVEQVTLSRVLPSTVVVEVVERTPMALARLNQHLYLVDRTGNIVDEYRAEHHEFDLPVVDGLLDGLPGEGDTVATDRIGAAVALFDGLTPRADLQQRLSHVDVANPRDVVVMMADDTAWLHLGDRAFVERLERYLDVRPALLDRFGSIEYADLKFDERIYVRGREQRTIESMAAR